MQGELVTAEDLKCWTEKDPVVSRVCRYVVWGWPSNDFGKEFQPIVYRQKELSAFNGCI